MEIKIKFSSNNFSLECSLNNTKIASEMLKILPQKSKVNIWGEEIYFKLPLYLENESPTLDVEEGDVAWWPDGSCFCIFFGKTPVSVSDKPKPYSEVTVVGKLKNYSKEIKNILKQTKPHTEVILEK
ncbi:MAG: cyclophilin-like fold protein [Endomicrobia bacterium]|nr:cyclophilin-like fold protein [Endomicrobiia bacterium]